MCLKEDEVQKQRQEIARAAVDRIIRETPRQISMEMYVRKVAFEAFAEGWNGKAEAVQAARAELDAAVEHHQYHIDQIEAALQDVYPTWNDHEFPGDWLTKVTATIRQLTPAGLCKVCGAVCDIYPDPPEQGTCYEHCEDHYFQVVDREARCYHCNQPAPDDWYDSEDV